MSMKLAQAIATLSPHNRILVYTGAGISTESGIPDFRGPNGLWTRVDPDAFTIDRYLSSPQRRVDGWRMHVDGALWGARSNIEPNAAHHAVTRLWSAGLTSGVITQNVDGLHIVAGIPRESISEIHRCFRTWSQGARVTDRDLAAVASELENRATMMSARISELEAELDAANEKIRKAGV